MTHAADGLPEDRIVCGDCTHCVIKRAYCKVHTFGVFVDRPFRCLQFKPFPAAEDQRTGLERWPTMKRDIEQVRALEATAKTA